MRMGFDFQLRQRERWPIEVPRVEMEMMPAPLRNQLVDADYDERLRLARDPRTPPWILSVLPRQWYRTVPPDAGVRREIVRACFGNPNLDVPALDRLVSWACLGNETTLRGITAAPATALAANPWLPLLLLETPGFVAELSQASVLGLCATSRLMPLLGAVLVEHVGRDGSKWKYTAHPILWAVSALRRSLRASGQLTLRERLRRLPAMPRGRTVLWNVREADR